MDTLQQHSIEVVDASRHQLSVEYKFKSTDDNHILQIPYWRPGRYEAGNFTRKYLNLRVFEYGKELDAIKLTPNTWKISCNEDEIISVRYSYYADELTAGNTYCDEEILLINPVNSLVYARGYEHDQGSFTIKYSKSWSWASGLQLISSAEGEVHLAYSDIQQVLDSPVLVCQHLQTLEYEVKGIHFYAHFGGEQVPNMAEIERDYKLFSEAQIKAFGSFPVQTYYFLNLLLPHKAYHGVEHENNTVIIYGPAEKLTQRKEYLDFMGVSSHELYHTWNVKSLRPAEWTPYNFEGPGFSRMGYVAEGVTTYMGDYMLWHSGVITDEEFLDELSLIVEKHLLNEGYKNLSLADSSVDTWVDGYGRTTPARRVSIYNEGAMLAIICDIWLIKNSDSSLNDFMKQFYELKGGKQGYSEQDYWKLLKKLADAPWQKLFDDCVNGRGKLFGYFKEALGYMGLDIQYLPSEKSWERYWGVRLLNSDKGVEIFNLKKGSAADLAGLDEGDTLLKIDGISPTEFLEQNRSKNLDTVDVEIKSGFRKKSLKLKPDESMGIPQYKVVLSGNTERFKAWKNAAHVNEMDKSI
jgi:predicted metalloprotease with PDZ domain